MCVYNLIIELAGCSCARENYGDIKGEVAQYSNSCALN